MEHHASPEYQQPLRQLLRSSASGDGDGGACCHTPQGTPQECVTMVDAVEQAMQQAAGHEERTPGPSVVCCVVALQRCCTVVSFSGKQAVAESPLHHCHEPTTQQPTTTPHLNRRLAPRSCCGAQEPRPRHLCQPAGLAPNSRPAAAHTSSQGPAIPCRCCCRQQAPAPPARGVEGGGVGVGSKGGGGDGAEF